MKQKILHVKRLDAELTEVISECGHGKIFVLTDEVTLEKCWPRLSNFLVLRDAVVITIKSTDAHKNLGSLEQVWTTLQQGGATRHSLLVNLGGGMVTDLGGFAASTFKRGMHFINIPTTLLAMVDASVGGKTGVNFGGLKNEIGVFNNADCVVLDTQFLQTLDAANILSGYAEMLKHGLISDDKTWAELINFDIVHPDLKALASMLARSVQVKERIVIKDPYEQGIRKALNLGHTVGHAFESVSLRRGKEASATTDGQPSAPLLHGYAVAFGLIVELYLSCLKTGFPVDKMRQTVRFIRENYGSFAIGCDDYDELITLMRHDKKNVGTKINFTLLADVGDVRINQTASEAEIKEAFDFFREG